MGSLARGGGREGEGDCVARPQTVTTLPPTGEKANKMLESKTAQRRHELVPSGNVTWCLPPFPTFPVSNALKNFQKYNGDKSRHRNTSLCNSPSL